MDKKYLGVDLGGTNIKYVVQNEQGEILEQNSLLTEDTIANPNKWKLNIINLIDRVANKYAPENKDQLVCGLSSPGLVGNDNLMIVNMPERLTGLENYNWSAELKREIFVINDAHSACLAEYETFYKSVTQNLLMLTLGTGVGGAAVAEGKIYQGTIQRAGHFGHITVDHMGQSTMTNMVGSLEYAIGNFSVKERTNNKFETTKDLVAAYNNNDPLASYWWLSSVQKLAVGISSLINAFSPEIIVIGGGIAEANDALFEPLKEFLSLYEWRPSGHQVKINKAKHANYAGAIGAAFFAKSKK
ncbi:MAG: ROK family protein [Saprospiraceae bacterium]